MGVFEIAAAELQREELQERLQRLKRDMHLTQEAIGRAEAEYYRLEGRIALLREQGAHEPPKRAKKRTVSPPEPRVVNPKRGKVADDALVIIAREGRPVGRSQLFKELTEQGMHLSGKNPLMVLSTMLWRERDRIVRLRGHGYWPADRPYPQADYYPGTEQPNLL